MDRASERSTSDRAAGPRLVRWPAQAQLRDDAARHGIPCLLVLDPGAPMPVIGPDEDWTSAQASERDVAARLAALAGRRRTADGPSGTSPGTELPPGLGDEEARVARVLLARAGHLIPRADLTRYEGPDAELDRLVDRVRRPLSGAGWRVHRVSTSGYLLRRVEVS